ncbi:hypothetical protein CEXT_743011 [Caerostris extrusa]|uniref:Uncharacterized protein n=1 Tax=Caerostris extrusa TaxID=172846 RepID=A0AAV4W0X2_CAEEX|nr:hypothetical protein CEXT_743011 [Caerostris extrusa]
MWPLSFRHSIRVILTITSKACHKMNCHRYENQKLLQELNRNVPHGSSSRILMAVLCNTVYLMILRFRGKVEVDFMTGVKNSTAVSHQKTKRPLSETS